MCDFFTAIETHPKSAALVCVFILIALTIIFENKK